MSKKTCQLLLNYSFVFLLFYIHSETFSFVLTGEDGSRRFGYCRRLLVGLKKVSVASSYSGFGLFFLIVELTI